VPQPLPRRILTRPAEGVKNNGWDNESWDLILATQVRGCPLLGTRVFWKVAIGGQGLVCGHCGCVRCGARCVRL
jgi:hypothetical protein